MIYSKEELLNIWREIIKVPQLNGSSLEKITSSDILYNFWRSCPRCGRNVDKILKIDGVWMCSRCGKDKLPRKWIRGLMAYRITNDLISFFGEVDSQKLFDCNLISAFVKATRLEENGAEYVLFLKFLRKVVEKELKGLRILDFLEEEGRKLTKRKIEKKEKEEDAEREQSRSQ